MYNLRGEHKCSKPGCDDECMCNACHKCQKHHDEDPDVRQGYF